MTTRPAHQRRLLTATVGVLATAMVPALSLLPADAADPHPRPPRAPSAHLSTADALTIGDPVAALADVDRQGTAPPDRAPSRRPPASWAPWSCAGTRSARRPRSSRRRPGLGAAPGNPAAGARALALRPRRRLRALTPTQVGALELVTAQQLAGTSARAVLFRQRFGDLPAATGGLVTVGVSNGKVRYVSSSLTRATTTSVAGRHPHPAPGLAGRRGRTSASRCPPPTPPGSPRRVADGWTRLAVPGFAQKQQVRLRALGHGRRHASVRSSRPTSSTSPAAPPRRTPCWSTRSPARCWSAATRSTTRSTTTSSPAPSPPPTCGPQHAFELTDANTKQINAVATALPADDVVVKIFGPSGLLQLTTCCTSPGGRHLRRPGRHAGRHLLRAGLPLRPAVGRGGRNYALDRQHQRHRDGAPRVTPVADLAVLPREPDARLARADPDQLGIGCWLLPDPRCNLPSGEFAQRRGARARGTRWPTVRPTLTTRRQQRQHPRGVGQPAHAGRQRAGAVLADPRVHRRVHRRLEQLQVRPGPADARAATTSSRR